MKKIKLISLKKDLHEKTNLRKYNFRWKNISRKIVRGRRFSGREMTRHSKKGQKKLRKVTVKTTGNR